MNKHFNVVSHGFLMKSHIHVNWKVIKGVWSIWTQLTKIFLFQRPWILYRFCDKTQLDRKKTSVRVHSSLVPGKMVWKSIAKCFAGKNRSVGTCTYLSISLYQPQDTNPHKIYLPFFQCWQAINDCKLCVFTWFKAGNLLLLQCNKAREQLKSSILPVLHWKKNPFPPLPCLSE